MVVNIEELGAVTLVKMKGQLVHPDGDAELRERFKEALDKGKSKFVFDLAGVPYCDSAGLGEMIACVKRAREAGGDVKFAGLNQRVSDTFMLLGMGQIVEIYGSTTEAIGYYTS